MEDGHWSRIVAGSLIVLALSGAGDVGLFLSLAAGFTALFGLLALGRRHVLYALAGLAVATRAVAVPLAAVSPEHAALAALPPAMLSAAVVLLGGAVFQLHGGREGALALGSGLAYPVLLVPALGLTWLAPVAMVALAGALLMQAQAWLAPARHSSAGIEA